MKTVFVMGAGMVSRPLVHYLLEHGYSVRLADINLPQAEAVVAGFANGTAMALDISDTKAVRSQVAQAHLVVSLLPPSFHGKVARLCLEENKHFLTASYLSPEIEAMGDEARARGLIFLNEMGLDPGLDHMTAMEMIDELEADGYVIQAFDSHCGGIPSKKAANNPLRYKLSWSPAGVLGAVTRPSRYRRDGALVEVPGEEKLAHAEILNIPGVGVFESNPNADSLYYGERYGITEVGTIRRGTLRYPGWAQFWLFAIAQGFHQREPKLNFQNVPALEALFQLTGRKAPADLCAFLVKEVGPQASQFLEVFESLGFLDPENLVSGSFSAFDLMLARMEASLQYDEDERDWVVLHHAFKVEKKGRREIWTSTLCREGTLGGSTAMAFLVGVPCAIGARLILEDKIESRGILLPLEKEIYAPVLKELGRLGAPHVVVRTPLET